MDCLEASCTNKRYLCFVRGCLMRNREKLKEYMQKYRFNQVLTRWKEQGKKCKYCDKILETIHHIDENHANNRLKNYQPVCQEHHLAIIHRSDIPQDMPNLASFKAKKTVIQPRTINTILQNCNITRICNLTLRNPITYRKIYIIEGSRHLVEFLGSIGFMEIIR